MGTLRSTIDMSGTVVNSCLLGVPAQDDSWFLWDDTHFPNGEIFEDGTIIFDGTEPEQS